MSQPTRHYSFALPPESQDSWYPAFDTWAQAMDTQLVVLAGAHVVHAGSDTVGSFVHAVAVVSCVPTADWTVVGTVNFAIDGGAWVALSVAPFGGNGGIVSTVNSGAQVMFTFDCIGHMTQAAQGFGGDSFLWSRLLVGSTWVPNSVGSPMPLNATGVDFRIRHTWVTSFGPGSYAVMPQMRLNYAFSQPTFVVDTNGHVSVQALVGMAP